jgi:hypothetical protein
MATVGTPASRKPIDGQTAPSAANGLVSCGTGAGAVGAQDQCDRAGVNEDLLRRIRGEFIEMPGLRLTFRQAQRLWGLDARTCESVLARLVGTKFLTVEGQMSSRDSEAGGSRDPSARVANAPLRGARR